MKNKNNLYKCRRLTINHFPSALRISCQIHKVFQNYWIKIVASQIFSVDFILFFSGYYLAIVKTVVYLTKYRKSRSFVWRNITKLSLSRLFKQDTEVSSISTHYQTELDFFSWSITLKLMILAKTNWQWLPHNLGPW